MHRCCRGSRKSRFVGIARGSGPMMLRPDSISGRVDGTTTLWPEVIDRAWRTVTSERLPLAAFRQRAPDVNEICKVESTNLLTRRWRLLYIGCCLCTLSSVTGRRQNEILVWSSRLPVTGMQHAISIQVAPPTLDKAMSVVYKSYGSDEGDEGANEFVNRPV